MAPKKIPNSRIMQHFFSLPEEQRIRLLKDHLSEETIKSMAANQFYKPMIQLRDLPEKEAKAFLKKYFGDSEEHLKKTVAHGEERLGGFKEQEYAKFSTDTDEEKLYAQVCSETLGNRLRIFYDDLNEKDKEPYIRGALASMKTAKVSSYILDNPKSYVEGKSPESFLNEVMKTMDLSKEKSMMERLRALVPEDDPERNEKLQCLAQQYMIFSESALEPESLAEKIQDKNWRKNFDTPKTMENEDRGMRLQRAKVLRRIRSTMNDIPETEEEKLLFKEAALQTCKEYRAFRGFNEKTKDPDEQEFLKLTTELQEELAAHGLKQKPVKDLQDSLAKEYSTLQKEKSGWFLSKTNTPEYDNMMKHLRLFNAKLDLLNGQQPKEPLTEEELKTVQNTNADILLSNAKQGCYNYATLKTKNGTGGFLHDAGSERFASSLKTLSQLGELGKKLYLNDPAAAERDEAQLRVLQNRRDGRWLSENIEDAVARTIYTQTILNRKMPAYQQRSLMEGDAINTQLEKIKGQSAFRMLMKTVSREKLADAVIKGGSSLYEVYNKASVTARREKQERTASEIEPDSLKPEHETQGLVPGKR